MKPDFVNVSVIVSSLVDLELRADLQVRGMKVFSFVCEIDQGFSHSSMITSPLKDLYTVGGFYLELGIYLVHCSPIFVLM